MRHASIALFIPFLLVACETRHSTTAAGAAPTASSSLVSPVWAPHPVTINADAGGAVLREIAQGADEGFVDLSLTIIGHEAQQDGRQRLVVMGRHKEDDVGFEVELPPSWSSAKLGGIDLVTYQGSVRVRSLGAQSDRFVKTLAQLFGTKTKPDRMTDWTEFTAISLGGNPRDLPAGPVKIKLFFEGKSEAEYAELFLNLDLPGRRAEFNEKDPEYREAVVRALSAGSR